MIPHYPHETTHDLLQIALARAYNTDTNDSAHQYLYSTRVGCPIPIQNKNSHLFTLFSAFIHNYTVMINITIKSVW